MPLACFKPRELTSNLVPSRNCPGLRRGEDASYSAPEPGSRWPRGGDRSSIHYLPAAACPWFFLSRCALLRRPVPMERPSRWAPTLASPSTLPVSASFCLPVRRAKSHWYLPGSGLPHRLPNQGSLQHRHPDCPGGRVWASPGPCESTRLRAGPGSSAQSSAKPRKLHLASQVKLHQRILC